MVRDEEITVNIKAIFVPDKKKIDNFFNQVLNDLTSLKNRKMK